MILFTQGENLAHIFLLSTAQRRHQNGSAQHTHWQAGETEVSLANPRIRVQGRDFHGKRLQESALLHLFLFIMIRIPFLILNRCTQSINYRKNTLTACQCCTTKCQPARWLSEVRTLSTQPKDLILLSETCTEAEGN